MTISSFFIFIPSILLGILTIHLVWPERHPLTLLLKLSLGVGLGLGISSILYFLILQVAPGRISIRGIQIILATNLLIFTAIRERNRKWNGVYLPRLSGLQWGLACTALIAFVISILTFFNTIVSRPQGEYDAWSIWNRAARFIYRDPENWQATLSPDIAALGHADYPLLVPLNVAWGWETLGGETLKVPMAQSALFTFAIILLMFSSLAVTRTIGQASLASAVLMASSGFILNGTNLTADIPLMFFIFASVVLMYLFSLNRNSTLLVLSGFMAGLAGWTKNEGLLFMAISPIAVIIVFPKKMSLPFLYYLAGMAIPLAIILYFKSMTPPNDLINSGNSLIEKVKDVSRYWIILKSLSTVILDAHVIVFTIYTVIMQSHPNHSSKQGIYTVATLLILQLLGYYAIYVITPNDLAWQLVTTQNRLIMHIIPPGLFLCFNIAADPETIFS